MISVVADLDFEVELPGRRPVRGSLRGRGRRLVLEVDRPEAFAGRSDARAIRAVADALANRGLRVRVESGDSHLITLGAVHVPWWQRRATGSRHIRLGGLRGAWTSGRTRLGRDTGPVLPDTTLVPPATLFPIAPTFLRRVRRHVTTTHDPGRGGSPRLVQALGDYHFPGERQPVFWLGDGVVGIGSAESSAIRLPGLAAQHAEISHDADDEYVLSAQATDVRVNGERILHARLRTGCRIQIGEHVLVFSREEHADHGRPYGGRIGGELGHQAPQPPREELQRPPVPGST